MRFAASPCTSRTSRRNGRPGQLIVPLPIIFPFPPSLNTTNPALHSQIRKEICIFCHVSGTPTVKVPVTRVRAFERGESHLAVFYVDVLVPLCSRTPQVFGLSSIELTARK